MKFLCDRCQTRYSIGDDRVRGKILKVRCKNCANVITVREGMPDPDAEPAPATPDAPRRPQKTTTAAPAIQSEAAAPGSPGGVLGAAFASAMARPAPALEAEWYVSIEGEQAGPFSLAEARRWVAAQPIDADLHCWSEGFDDWLPIDKVSHFRGLRKPPAPAQAAPPVQAPPVSRAPAAAAGPAPRPSEDEPKPMFAATMATLEKGGASAGLGAAVSPAPAPLRGLGAAPAARPLDLRGIPGSPRPAATPSNGYPPVPGLANGAALQARAAAPAAAPAEKPRGPIHAVTQPGVGLTPLQPAFDPGELGDSPTQIAAPSFEPGAGAGGTGAGDDLEIGEVSRVVKLADLAKAATARPRPATGAPPGPSALSRTGAVPRFGLPRAAEPMPSAPVDTGDPLLLGGGVVDEPAPAAVSHRRGMIALIAGAIVLVGVAVAVVVFFMRSNEEVAGGGLGRVDEIDTTRPDEVRRLGGGSGGDTASATPADPTPNPFVPRPKRPVTPPPVTPPPVTPPESPATGTRLEAREIEDMAAKSSSVTQRCYMRAQRGVDGILLGDVKKIAVTLTISGDGTVADAQLSDNQGANSLGKCLLGSIRTWKFRPSPGGTFRFVLHFG